MKLPTLYKKTSTGAIQFWDIETMEGYDYNEVDEWEVGTIKTTYGQMGTESPQTTSDVINIGKNIGKKNETTAPQQAEFEAKSLWEKKKKSGYVDNITSAENGEIDALVEGGVVPMLAHKYSEHGHKIKYPCYAQPKLDGIRCIAILKNRKCTLWSRTRKQITSMPHIVAEIERIFIDDIILDGELYSHSFRSVPGGMEKIPEGEIYVSGSEKGFEHIVHLVRQEEPDQNCTDVQYHLYDIVNDKLFDRRNQILYNCFTLGTPKFEYLQRVPTSYLEDDSDIAEAFDIYTAIGYEGMMLRNSESPYVNKRSYDLQKMKEFDEEEFTISGIEEGRGKLSGHVGAFVCRTKDGKEFLAKMSGETNRLKEFFLDHSLWIGKMLSVQFQGLTGKEGVPRFPVGKAIRDYE